MKSFHNVLIDNAGRIFDQDLFELDFQNSRSKNLKAVNMSNEIKISRSNKSGASFISHVESYYGGILYPHYGHFLLESLSRLSTYNGVNEIIWSSVMQDKFTKYQWDILSFLLPKGTSVRLITNLAFFGKINIADRGFIITNRCTKTHLEFLHRVGEKVGLNNDFMNQKIWITRRGIRSIENEQLLESALVKLGWIVVDTSRLPVAKQVGIFTSAKVIAGVRGSGLHTVIFSKRTDLKMIIVGRQEDPAYEANRDNYDLINSAMRLCVTRINGNTNIRDVSRAKFIADLINACVERETSHAMDI
ncbi:glycosyltransferase 61 family protein [Synechococcus sp. N26]|uniref:glycosyltransferase 61 family protein n=1 Tax=Synechococcus sp. N26 TaxID=2575513 RepID=UPI000E0F5C2F|nr:glycosyltransferase family 61 protein [Synechococcus sp. N26]